MTPLVFGGGIALISALVLSVSVAAYVQLLRAEERLPDFRRRVWLDLLRAVPWGLGLTGGLAVALGRPVGAGIVEAAGWALGALGVLQFAMEIGARLWLRQPSAPGEDDGVPVPLAGPVLGAAVGLGVMLLLAWGVIAGARTL